MFLLATSCRDDKQIVVEIITVARRSTVHVPVVAAAAATDDIRISAAAALYNFFQE